jgi:hypothetical protein
MFSSKILTENLMRGRSTVTEYYENTEEYLSGTFETYLELRTGRDSVSFADRQDLQAFLDEFGVPYGRTAHLPFPPSDQDELGELVSFVNDMEVVE